MEVKKLIENIESVYQTPLPNFRQDIQEYFTSLNLQDLLLKEYEPLANPQILERLEKFATDKFMCNDEDTQLDDTASQSMRFVECKGYIGNIYSAD